MAILHAFARGGAVFGAVILLLALLKKLILMVGVLMALVKLAIIVTFVAMFVMIALAILRDRSSRKSEATGL